jgi:hypothetical protein
MSTHKDFHENVWLYINLLIKWPAALEGASEFDIYTNSVTTSKFQFPASSSCRSLLILGTHFLHCAPVFHLTGVPKIVSAMLTLQKEVPRIRLSTSPSTSYISPSSIPTHTEFGSDNLVQARGGWR